MKTKLVTIILILVILLAGALYKANEYRTTLNWYQRADRLNDRYFDKEYVFVGSLDYENASKCIKDLPKKLFYTR